MVQLLRVWFKGLRGKLLISAVLPVVALGIVSWITVSGISRVGNLLDEAHANFIPTIDSIDRMNGSASNMVRFLWKTYALKGDIAERDKSIQRVRDALSASGGSGFRAGASTARNCSMGFLRVVPCTRSLASPTFLSK